MSYKYRKGSTPDHVDSSMSNPTYPHVTSDTTKVKQQGSPRSSSSNPDDAVKKAFREAQAKGDTQTVRRIRERVSTPKKTEPDSTRIKKDLAKNEDSQKMLSRVFNSRNPADTSYARQLAEEHKAKSDTLAAMRKGKKP